jgi:hypothetical protein
MGRGQCQSDFRVRMGNSTIAIMTKLIHMMPSVDPACEAGAFVAVGVASCRGATASAPDMLPITGLKAVVESAKIMIARETTTTKAMRVDLLCMQSRSISRR